MRSGATGMAGAGQGRPQVHPDELGLQVAELQGDDERPLQPLDRLVRPADALEHHPEHVQGERRIPPIVRCLQHPDRVRQVLDRILDALEASERPADVPLDDRAGHRGVRRKPGKRLLEERKAALEIGVAVRQPPVRRVCAGELIRPACRRDRVAERGLRGATVSGVHPQVGQARERGARVELLCEVARQPLPRRDRSLQEGCGSRVEEANRSLGRREAERDRDGQRAGRPELGGRKRVPGCGDRVGARGRGLLQVGRRALPDPAGERACDREVGARPSGRSCGAPDGQAIERMAEGIPAAPLDEQAGGDRRIERRHEPALEIGQDGSEGREVDLGSELCGGPDELEGRAGQAGRAIGDESSDGLGCLRHRRGCLSSDRAAGGCPGCRRHEPDVVVQR